MNIYLPLILVILSAITGVIWLIDALCWARKRQERGEKMPFYVDYSKSFFPLLIILLVIRSFLVQPYEVPSGSLEPTIKPVEFILVSQFSYGLRLPILRTKILNIGEPKSGDIVVFYAPPNPSIAYIKRVIGVPGDHISYKNKKLTINGKQISQKFLYNAIDTGEVGDAKVKVMEEDLLGIKHKIYLRQQGGEAENYDFIVPPGNYFMMGDNRDGSADSRFWGFVPEKNLVGKGKRILFSWDKAKHKIRWHRIGTRL